MNIDTDNPTATFKLDFDDDTVEIVVEYHFSENAEEFIDVEQFVNLASAMLMRGMM